MPRNLSSWLSHLEALSAQRDLQSLPRTRDRRFALLKTLASALDILHWSCPVVTVAGTNGKTSCVSLLASIFSSANYRVGSFTSPHLLRYNERIQVNQRPVDDALLCQAFSCVEEARQDALLGYFEFTTLAALWIFKQINPDILVLEVGLGGRLDPVNMIDADIAIISSIDFDHTHILGNTLEAIAFEKAGIMRPNKPCIWGDTTVPENIKAYAKQLRTPLFVYTQDFEAESVARIAEDQYRWTWSGVQQSLINLPLPHITFLPNAACVLQAVDLLEKQLPLSQKDLEYSLQHFSVPGRHQLLTGKTKTILDVAHNPASASLLANKIKNYSIRGRILLVIAVLNTKDIEGMILPLLGMVSEWYVGQFELPACATAETVTHLLMKQHISNYRTYASVAAAYQTAQREAQSDDVIVVMGSFHTVAAVMQLEEKEPISDDHVMG